MIEDLYHVVMQCPDTKHLRDDMINRIYEIDPIIERNFHLHPSEVVNWMIGKEIPDVEKETMYKVWQVSGVYINEMYTRKCMMKTGVR